MSLATLNEILPAARAQGRAIGAFNIANLETVAAVVQAAEEERSPIILQVFHRLFNDGRIRPLSALAVAAAEQASVPVAVHLDHGASIAQVTQAIRYGFTSVMFDGSQLGFEENVRLSRQVVEMAHAAGLSAEAEIGHVPLSTDDDVPLSDPDEAVQFAERTGADALAIAIGTKHGFYKSAPTIDVERCRRIGQRLPIPLVLHGGTGTPMDKVQATIRCGIAKVNIATEFQHQFLELTDKATREKGGEFLPVDRFMLPVIEKLRDFVRERIRSLANA